MCATFLLKFMGWKTLIVGCECKASLSLNRLKVSIGNEYQLFSLQDLNTVIFSHSLTLMSIPLISELMKNNISIIICDEKNDPIGQFLPFNNHSLVFDKLNNQIQWKITIKKKFWKKIIENKIASEIQCLILVKKEESEETRKKLLENLEEIYNNDQTNREGVSARIYFSCLFGEDFTRDDTNSINAALNYGYKIIASYISKCIVSRGLITQLGVHHIGESNAFNLTYDFVEPFRALVDAWTYINIKEEFSVMHKQELIKLLDKKVSIKEKFYRLKDAIEIIIDSYISFLNEEKDDLLSIDISKGIKNEEV